MTVNNLSVDHVWAGMWLKKEMVNLARLTFSFVDLLCLFGLFSKTV